MATSFGLIALAGGTVLALGAALVVLSPLWSGAGDEPLPADERANAGRRGASSPAGPAARVDGVSAVEALREIEFDRETGKLADDDYAALKATYTREALAELRASARRTALAEDPVEAELRDYRARRSTVGAAGVCVACGPRPEGDAEFCSNCGRFLAQQCPACGAACDREAQRFCADCGTTLGTTPALAAAG